jgi:hypothetical protein
MAAINPNCAGCRTASFCVETISVAVAHGESAVAAMDQELSRYHAGEPDTSPSALMITAQVVTLGGLTLLGDMQRLVVATEVCPGRETDGSCGLQPDEQLALLPEYVNTQDPRYQAIAAAAEAAGNLAD